MGEVEFFYNLKYKTKPQENPKTKALQKIQMLLENLENRTYKTTSSYTINVVSAANQITKLQKENNDNSTFFSESEISTRVAKAQTNAIKSMLVNSKKRSLMKNLVQDNFPVPERRKKSCISLFQSMTTCEGSTCSSQDEEDLKNNKQDDIILSSPSHALSESTITPHKFMTGFFEQEEEEEEEDYDLSAPKNGANFNFLQKSVIESEKVLAIPNDKINQVKSCPDIIISDKNNKLSNTGNKGICGLILSRVSSFQQHLKGKLSMKQSQEFNILIKQMIEYIELIDETLKGYRADSIADALLLLVSSQIGVSKTDFLKNLKVGQRATVGRINEIKKFYSYRHLKKGLKAINKTR